MTSDSHSLRRGLVSLGTAVAMMVSLGLFAAPQLGVNAAEAASTSSTAAAVDSECEADCSGGECECEALVFAKCGCHDNGSPSCFCL